MGLHLKAQNPGGFLSTAIRENFAANHVHPDSEAAAVRQREHKQPGPISPPSVIAPPRSQPSDIPIPKAQNEIAASIFDQLPLSERSEYEVQAKAALVSTPPSWLISLMERHGFEHAAIQGALKSKAIAIWQAVTGELRSTPNGRSMALS